MADFDPTQAGDVEVGQATGFDPIKAGDVAVATEQAPPAQTFAPGSPREIARQQATPYLPTAITSDQPLITGEQLPYQEGESPVVRGLKATQNVVNKFGVALTKPSSLAGILFPPLGLAQAATAIIQQPGEIKRAFTETPPGSPERAEAVAGGALSLGMLLFGAKGLREGIRADTALPPEAAALTERPPVPPIGETVATPMVAPEVPLSVEPKPEIGGPSATQEGIKPEGNQPEYTGNAPSGAPAEAGGGGGVEPSAQVPQEVAAETKTTEPAAATEEGGRADVMALAAAEQPRQLETQDLFKGFGEETPQSQKIGLLPQPSEFVKTDVAKAVQGAIKGAQQVKAAFAPPNVSEVAGVTARVIRENAAQLARNKEMATVGLQDAASALRKNTPAANLDIINKLETGQTLPSAALDQYKTARQAGYDQRITQVRAVNPNALQDLIENYFPHLWTKESIAKVQGNLANLPPDNPWARVFGKRPLAGPATFLKQRTIPTTADGIAIGLEPVTTNPVALDLLKMHEMDRYVMGQKIMGELKDQGIAKFVPSGSKADFGYTKIDDRIARVLAPREWKIVNEAGEEMPGQKLLGDYYAPDDAARVINNYLSPGLKGNAIYDGFRFVGNLMNQVQLGISLYHATFTSIDAATSTLALGLEQVARSGGSPAELATAASNIAKAFVEAPVGGAMVENLWRGNKFLREYSKPGTTNAELAKIVDAAVAGGARVRMDTFYNTGAVGSFFDALKSGNYAGAVLRAPFAVVQAAAKPLMEYAVPRMKLGIISQNLEYELSKLPKEATRDDVRKVAARAVDSVDNRMGQLIYDNLFWNRTLKDGLMASVRSVGWNLGDIRELGGGVLDTITAPKRAYRELTKGSQIADNPIVTKRMAYMVALPVMVGALGSMYQYLTTGEGPKDLMDVYMPRTGRMKQDGTPERVMLPTYMKDIAPLALAATREGAVGLTRRTYSMALNKLHPAITMTGQMLHNQDYYGNQIRNEDDGLVQTIQKEAEFVGKSFRPFSVQGVIQREGGAKEKAQAVVGLMPAPRELTDTPAMRMMHNINLSKRPAGGYTEAQQQKREDKRKASQGQDLRPDMFKRLSKDEKARVLEVSTPEERGVFQSGKKPFGRK